jgi:hypothetical protein
MLVNCLVYEEIATMGLDEQIALDVQSLTLQQGTAKGAKERSLAALFALSNRLDVAFDGYRNAAESVEATIHELTEQRAAIRVNRLNVDRLNAELFDAKTAYLRSRRLPLGGRVEGDFGVYVTGCRPEEHLTRGKSDE